MLKRLCLAFAGFFALASSVMAAGTIPLSMTQQLDSFGKPLSGGKLYFIQAGTTSTPQNAYQDAALTLVLPNPVTLDASGRIPQLFLADGSIKIRLTDKNGVTQVVADGILVIGPSSGGGGGGGGVDPTTIFATGDTLWSDISSTRTGWVRDNGRSIGSASSGATERANADTEALFNFLWQTYDNTICPVSSGRGVSSAADWAANKTIATPDKRGYIVGGLDDMGNSAAGRFANVPVVSGSVTTPGSVIGEALHTLTIAEMPDHNHGGLTSTVQPTATVSGGTLGGTGTGQGSGPSTNFLTGAANIVVTVSAHQHNIPSAGGGGAHNNVQKTVLGSFFRKL